MVQSNMAQSKEPTWCLLSDAVGRVLRSLPVPAQAIGPSREAPLRDTGWPQSRPSVRQAHPARDRHVTQASRPTVSRREATALDAPATSRQHTCTRRTRR